MKFTIVTYPSQFSDTDYNYLLIRVEDGAIVGMIEECAVADLRKILNMRKKDEIKQEMDDRQMRIPYAVRIKLDGPIS